MVRLCKVVLIIFFWSFVVVIEVSGVCYFFFLVVVLLVVWVGNLVGVVVWSVGWSIFVGLGDIFRV